MKSQPSRIIQRVFRIYSVAVSSFTAVSGATRGVMYSGEISTSPEYGEIFGGNLNLSNRMEAIRDAVWRREAAEGLGGLRHFRHQVGIAQGFRQEILQFVFRSGPQKARSRKREAGHYFSRRLSPAGWATARAGGDGRQAQSAPPLRECCRPPYGPSRFQPDGDWEARKRYRDFVAGVAGRGSPSAFEKVTASAIPGWEYFVEPVWNISSPDGRR